MTTIRLSNPSLFLEANSDPSGVKLKIQFFDTPITTKKMTHILEVLDQKLPKIFLNKCFNDLNLTFREEVQATPLGHLFEHILLEYLCDELEISGARDICVRGETQWDWDADPVGLYHIKLSGLMVDKSQLKRAINQSIVLTQEIISPPVQTWPDFLIQPALAHAISFSNQTLSSRSIHAHKTANRLELLELNP
jgi:hypothetical protein